MYLYFDKKGTLKTKIDHGEKARQGNPLKVTVCLDTDFFDNLCKLNNYDDKYKHIYNWVLSVDLSKNGEHIPFASQSAIVGTERVFIKEYDGEVTYDLQNFKRYIMYDVNVPAGQFVQLGTAFEMIFTLVTAPTESSSEEVTEVDNYSHNLAAVTVEVEQTFGQVSYKITVSQYQNMLNTIRSFAQQYTIDEEPLDDSDHLVKSGGVKKALDDLSAEVDSKFDNVYTKSATDSLLNDKADKSNTYTKDQMNGLLNDKADKNNTYTQAQINARLEELGEEVESHAAIQNINGVLSIEDIDALFGEKPEGIYRITSEDLGPETVYIHYKNDEVEGDEDYFKRYTASYAYSYDFELNSWQIASGAGGGTGTGSTGGGNITLTAKSPFNQTVALGAEATLRFFYRSNVSSSGTAYLYKGSGQNLILQEIKTINKGDNYFTVTNLIQAGETNFTITAKDTANNTADVLFKVTGVKLKITSYFDDSIIRDGETIQFIYDPSGNEQATVHYVLDGVETTEDININGSSRTYNITNLTHGIHTFSVYMTSLIEDILVTSNTLTYQIIYNDGISDDIIIASKFNQAEVTQGQLISIDYIVFSRQYLNTSVSLLINDEPKQTNVTINRNKHFWNLINYPLGDVTFTIIATDQDENTTSKNFIVHVSEPTTNINELADSLMLSLTNDNRNNSESEPQRSTWSYGNISATLTDFNWSANGWVVDEQSYPILRINGTSKVEIPVKIFQNASDFAQNGKTIEITFKVQDVVSTDNVLISCFSNNIGFTITANDFTFKSAQKTIITKFKEEEKIQIALSIHQSNSDRLIEMFINGVSSGVIQYAGNDSFIQRNPANIIINPNQNGFIDIYSIRIYNKALNHREVLQNYIAGQNLADKYTLSEKNNIFDQLGNVSFDSIRQLIPILTIIGPLPKIKGDEQEDIICIYEDSSVSDGSKNFRDEHCSIDVQGTSSQYYPRKNYKIKFSHEISLYEGAIPETTFTFKADFMESSHSHNTGAAKIINELSPKNPKQLNNPNVRNSIYGFPVVIFHKDTEGSETSEYFGVYNFNNDKKNNNTIGLDDNQCESWEFRNSDTLLCLFKESSTINFDNISAVEGSFEARYPKFKSGQENYTNLKRVIDWVASTEEDIDKFRTEFESYFNKEFCLFYYIMMDVLLAVDSRAKNMFLDTFDGNIWYPRWYDIDTIFGLNNEGVLKFSYDLEQHDVQGGNVYNGAASVLWNNFEIAFADDIKAYYQTLRNNGLTYDYILSVINDEQVAKISAAMYNTDNQFKYISSFLAGKGFEEWQQAAQDFSQELKGDWLYIAQGTRLEHFKWWLKNRLNYLDSKYETTNFLTDYITLRIYTPNPLEADYNTGETIENVMASLVAVPANHDLTLTPYRSIYCTVKYQEIPIKTRGHENTTTTLESPLSAAPGDAVLVVYGASQLLSLGNLAGQYADTVQVDSAIRLKDLILGDENTDYYNKNLRSLNLTHNTLLQTLDVRGCINLSGELDLSQCRSLKTVYANRTALTSVTLPAEGGNLHTLYLPATITTIDIVNQPFLTAFYIEDYNNLQTIRIKNTPIPLATVYNMITVYNVSQVILEEINWTFDNSNIDNINTVTRLGERLTIEGNINIECPVYQGNLNAWRNSFGTNVNIADPSIIISDDYITEIVVEVNNSSTLVGFEIADRPNNDYTGLRISIDWGDGYREDKPLSNYLKYCFKNSGYYNRQSAVVYHYYDTPLSTQQYTVHFVIFSDSNGVINVPIASLKFSEMYFGSSSSWSSGSLPRLQSNVVININQFQPYIFSNIDLSLCRYLNTVAQFPNSINSIIIGNQIATLSENANINIRFEEPNTEMDFVIYGLFERLAINNDHNIKSIVLRNDTKKIEYYNTTTEDTLLKSTYFYSNKSDMVATLNNIVEDDDIYYIPFNNGKYALAGGMLDSYNHLSNAYYLNENTVIIPQNSFRLTYAGSTVSHSNYIILNEGLLYINSKSLYYLIGELNIPSTVKQIGLEPAGNNSQITTITVNANNNWYDSRNSCNAIIETATNQLIFGNKYTIIPSSVTSLAQYAFYAQTNLPDSILPYDINFTVIPGYAFYNATFEGQHVIIPEGVTQIQSYAFYNTNIAELTLPSTLTNIANYNFGRTSCNVTRINIPSLEMICNLQIGSAQVFVRDTTATTAHKLYINNEPLTNITTPETVTEIKDNCFTYTDCEEFTISDYITTISRGALEYCTFTTLNIGSSVISLPVAFVHGCKNLTSVTIPGNITSIGDSAFEGCSGLTGVTIPNSVTRIGSNAFQDCTSLTTITIPNSVTNIGGSTFLRCNKLTSITLGSGITSIPGDMFQNCTKLASITIPNSVASIGGRAFYYCSALTSITIPDSVTSIGQSAFMGCSHLASVTLPNNITTIFNEVFQGTGLGSITIPDSVTSIRDRAFAGCNQMQTVTIGSGLKSIAEEAFLGCSKLASINIPDGVNSIGRYAFQNCSKLTNITIPASINSMGLGIFSGCSSLTTVTMLKETPPTLPLSNDNFPYLNTGFKIIVPAGKKETYISATNWSIYAAYIEEAEE